MLFSRSSSYRLLGETCRDGALRAIAEIEADPDLPFRFLPVERDPGGNVDLYYIWGWRSVVLQAT